MSFIQLLMSFFILGGGVVIQAILDTHQRSDHKNVTDGETSSHVEDSALIGAATIIDESESN